MEPHPTQIKMKKYSIYGIAFLATALLTPVVSHAEDVEAELRLNGSVQNNRARQTIQANFAGEGEFDPFDTDAKIDGTVRTQSGERLSQVSVYGDYPVQVYARARRGDRSASDTFDATVELRRRYVNFRGIGKIYLDRPVNPRRPGRQTLSGRGTLRYDF